MTHVVDSSDLYRLTLHLDLTVRMPSDASWNRYCTARSPSVTDADVAERPAGVADERHHTRDIHPPSVRSGAGPDGDASLDWLDDQHGRNARRSRIRAAGGFQRSSVGRALSSVMSRHAALDDRTGKVLDGEVLAGWAPRRVTEGWLSPCIAASRTTVWPVGQPFVEVPDTGDTFIERHISTNSASTIGHIHDKTSGLLPPVHGSCPQQTIESSARSGWSVVKA